MSGIPKKLYHYTSKGEASQIERDGVIKATPGDSKHAHYGRGVYLSDVPPSSTDREVKAANWRGQVREEKIQSAIEVDTSKIQVEKHHDAEGNRNVYKVCGDVPLGNDYQRVDRK